MAESRISIDLAIETLKSPPPVVSKLTALDALDRLALNPNAWFTDSVLDQLTDARKAIITDRWSRALETLESTRLSLDSFVSTLKAGDANEERRHAIDRATQEIQQLVLVLAWLDKRPPG